MYAIEIVVYYDIYDVHFTIISSPFQANWAPKGGGALIKMSVIFVSFFKYIYLFNTAVLRPIQGIFTQGSVFSGLSMPWKSVLNF
jgi:hypothetical protein